MRYNLIRFADVLVPIIDIIIPLRRKLDQSSQNTKSIPIKNETLIKNLVLGGMRIFWNTIDSSKILPSFTGLLIEQLNLDYISIYTPNKDGKLYKLYSEGINILDSPFQTPKQQFISEELMKKIKKPSKISQNQFTKYYSDTSLVIPVVDSNSNQLLAVLELERYNTDTIRDVQRLFNATNGLLEENRTQEIMNIRHSSYAKFGEKQQPFQGLQNIPEFVIEFLPMLLMNILNCIQTLSKSNFEAELQALQSQFTELQNVNKTIQNKVNHYQLLHEFTLRLRDIISFEDIVNIFNETFASSFIKPEYAAIFFSNPQNSTYFTYNYLGNQYPEKKHSPSNIPGSFDFQSSRLVLNKNESSLCKLFEDLGPNQIINLNYEDKSYQNILSISPNKLNESETDSVLLNFPLINFQLPFSQTVSNQLSHRTSEIGQSQRPFTISDNFTPNKHQNILKKLAIQNLLVAPIVINEKSFAYIVLGNSNVSTKFTSYDEAFMKDLAHIFHNFFGDQFKLNESMTNIAIKLEKKKTKSSQMKTYRALLLNQDLKSEYSLYKKYHNLQSFIFFLENTYAKLLNSQIARVLLYNDTKSTVYFYPKLQKSEVIEIPSQCFHNSLTGNCIIRNEVFIFPQIKRTEDMQSGTNITLSDNSLSFRSNNINKGAETKFNSFMFEYPSFPHRQENSPSFTFQGFENIGRLITQNDISYSLSTSNRNHYANGFEKLPNYNHLVDNIHNISDENKILMDNSGPINSSQSKKKIMSFLCLPILDENEKVVAVVQIFNKQQEENQTFTKKDIIKIQAISEAIMPKLKKIMKIPTILHSKDCITSSYKIAKIYKKQLMKTLKYSFSRIKDKIMENMYHEKIKWSKNLGFDLLKVLMRKRLNIYFEKLKLEMSIKKIREAQDTNKQVENSSINKGLSLKIFASVFRSIEYRATLGVIYKLKRIVFENKNHNDKDGNLNRIKGVVLKGLCIKFNRKFQLHCISKWRKSEDSSRTEIIINSFRMIKYRSISLCLKNITQNTLRNGFTLIRNSRIRHENEIKLINDIYFEISCNNHGLISFFELVHDFFKKMYHFAVRINVAFIDVLGEKVICYNKLADEEMIIMNPSKKQMKNIERVMETDCLKLVDSVKNLILKVINSNV